MIDYSKGKIYKIIGRDSDGNEECYIGSTCQPYLSSRMGSHRARYKGWLKGTDHFVTSYLLFDKFGVENCYIE